jgi:hypothetical protein
MKVVMRLKTWDEMKQQFEVDGDGNIDIFGISFDQKMESRCPNHRLIVANHETAFIGTYICWEPAEKEYWDISMDMCQNIWFDTAPGQIFCGADGKYYELTEDDVFLELAESSTVLPSDLKCELKDIIRVELSQYVGKDDTKMDHIVRSLTTKIQTHLLEYFDRVVSEK